MKKRQLIKENEQLRQRIAKLESVLAHARKVIDNEEVLPAPVTGITWEIAPAAGANDARYAFGVYPHMQSKSVYITYLPPYPGDKIGESGDCDEAEELRRCLEIARSTLLRIARYDDNSLIYDACGVAMRGYKESEECMLVDE